MPNNDVLLIVQNTLGRKIVNTVIAGSGMILMFFLFMAITWHILPKQGIRINSTSIINTQVKPGDYLKVAYDIDRDLTCKVDVQRFLENEESEIISTDSVTMGLIEGKTKKTVVDVKVPESVFPGRWKLITAYSHRCNPLQNEVVEYTTPLSFTVTK